MTQDNPRLAVLWSPQARADLRSIDRDTALQILHCLDRYLLHRDGDVKKLKPLDDVEVEVVRTNNPLRIQAR